LHYPPRGHYERWLNLTTAASARGGALQASRHYQLNELDPESYLRHILARMPDDPHRQDRRAAA